MKKMNVSKTFKTFISKAQSFTKEFLISCKNLKASLEAKYEEFNKRVEKNKAKAKKDEFHSLLARMNLVDFNFKKNRTYTDDGYRVRAFCFAGFKNRNLNKAI